MKKIELILFLLIASACFGQELPDKPMPQKKHSSNFDVTVDKYGDYKLPPSVWNGNSRNGKILFWSIAAADVGATLFDAHQTMAGTKTHICGERNIGGYNSFPSARRVYGETLGWTAGIIGAAYVFKRLTFPVTPYAMMGVQMGKHIHGGMAWYGTGCL